MNKDKNETTDFGYREVSEAEKSKLVENVFRSVASKYDLMNDVMSFRMHRLWKRFALREASLRRGHKILDVASGTGDLAAACVKAVGKEGKVLMTDINDAMLKIGRDKLANQGIIGNVFCVQADAEKLPFVNNYFDCIFIAFGLRNVTHKATALKDMHRVLKPGGKILILEFSEAKLPLLSKLYESYSFNIIPKLGKWITNDRASYQYLVESIRRHPNQEQLKTLMHQAGFEDIHYFNLCGGIVALHTGYKY